MTISFPIFRSLLYFDSTYSLVKVDGVLSGNDIRDGRSLLARRLLSGSLGRHFLISMLDYDYRARCAESDRGRTYGYGCRIVVGGLSNVQKSCQCCGFQAKIRCALVQASMIQDLLLALIVRHQTQVDLTKRRSSSTTTK